MRRRTEHLFSDYSSQPTTESAMSEVHDTLQGTSARVRCARTRTQCAYTFVSLRRFVLFNSVSTYHVISLVAPPPSPWFVTYSHSTSSRDQWLVL